MVRTQALFATTRYLASYSMSLCLNFLICIMEKYNKNAWPADLMGLLGESKVPLCMNMPGNGHMQGKYKGIFKAFYLEIISSSQKVAKLKIVQRIFTYYTYFFFWTIHGKLHASWFFTPKHFSVYLLTGIFTYCSIVINFLDLHYLTHHPCYNFFTWSKNSILPPSTGSSLRIGIAFGFHVSLAFFNLKHSHSLSLSYMILIFLKNIVPHFNKMFLILHLCDVSLWLD